MKTAVLFVPSSFDIRKIRTFERICSMDPTIDNFELYGALDDQKTYSNEIKDQIGTWVSLKRYNKTMSPLLTLERSPNICIFSPDNINDRILVNTRDGNTIPDIDVEIDRMLENNYIDTSLFISSHPICLCE